MICATLREAKAKLNSLVEKATSGEDVVLMRGSKHVAAIVAISEKDLLISRQLSDAQADHLWSLIEADRQAGRLREVKEPKEVLA